MIEGLKSLVAISLLSGAVLWLCPEGSAKRVTRVLCTALLVAAVAMPLRDFDFDALSLAEAKVNSAQAEIINGGMERENLLRELVMAQNCEQYIVEKGNALGLRDLHATVELKKDVNGAWLPWAATVSGACADSVQDPGGRRGVRPDFRQRRCGRVRRRFKRRSQT